VVYDALRIMRIARPRAAGLWIGEAAGELGVERIAHVHHVQAAAAGVAPAVRAREVHVAADGIGDDIVHAVHTTIDVIRGECLWRAHTAQPVQVEDLHPRLARAVGHDERVVLVGLDLAPERPDRARGLGQVAEIYGPARVGDVDERGAIDATDDRDFLARFRIVVAPHVAELHATLTADLRDRQERHQVDLIAIEHLNLAALALALGSGDGAQRGDVADELGRIRPRAGRAAREQRDGSLAVIVVADGDGDERSRGGNALAESFAVFHTWRAQLRRPGEARRVTRDAIDPAAESIRAVAAHPQLVSHFGDRRAETRPERAVERQGAVDGVPAVLHRVAREHPHGAGDTVVDRADQCGVATQHDGAAELRVPAGHRTRRRNANFHLPGTRGIAIVNVHRTRTGVGTGAADHEATARSGERGTELRIRHRIELRKSRFSRPRVAVSLEDVHAGLAALRAVGDIGPIARNEQICPEAAIGFPLRCRNPAALAPPARRFAGKQIHRAAAGIGLRRADEQRVAVDRDRAPEAVAV